MNGDVVLNDSVLSYPQYLEAAAAARRVHCVTSVHNHLMVILPPCGCRDDPTLTIAANNALALNIPVPDDVEATASDGNVWLTGTVRHGSQRKATVRPAGQSRRAGRCSR
jgi:osmotically-inducible protein OsmY